MRSLFLILLLANLLLFAAQFDVVRDLVWDGHPALRAAQMNAERMRIIHDTSTRPRAPATPTDPAS